MENNRMKLVEGWLASMGIGQATPINDPATLWHLQFNYPAGSPHIMHAVCPKSMPDGVVVASKVDIGVDLIEGFDALDADAKEEFLWKLRETLNTPWVDFQLEGVASPLDCPKGIQTTAVRFFDGVTLDSFARSVGFVYKTELSALWVLHRYIGPRGYGTGDRFDFKRLGM